jgi:UDP-glucose 4-epimerase
MITGATGFVGSAVIQRLLTMKNVSLIAGSRRNEKVWPSGVTSLLLSDLENSNQTIPLVGVEAVIHCAARTHIMNDQAVDPLAEFRKANVAGTLNLARQAAEAGVRRFIFISSIKVNGEGTELGKPYTEDDVPAPVDPYGISKLEAEQGLLAARTDMEVVIIRPPLVYGPGVKGNFATMMQWLAKGLPLPLGALRSNRRSLVAITNLVDLIVTCLEHPAAANQVLLAGDGEDFSTAELLYRVAEAMDKQARLIPVPTAILEMVAGLLGKRAVAQRLCSSLQVDISKARTLLGWIPPVTFKEELLRTVGKT